MKTVIVTVDELNSLARQITNLKNENQELKQTVNKLEIKLIARALADRLNSEEGKAAMQKAENETKKEIARTLKYASRRPGDK